MVSHTVARCRIDVCTWPTLRGAKRLSSISYLYASCVHIAPTSFYCTEAILMRSEHQNNSPRTTAFVLHHTRALNNW